MMGRQTGDQSQLFYSFNLDERISDRHLLRRINPVVTRVLGGPFCSQFLGDHGADVIKIEPPQGDETRGWGPPFVEDTASYFIGVYRNKRGVALGLS